MSPASPVGSSKVPVVTAAFWVVKILSTTVGETGADSLAVQAGLGGGLTTLLTLAVLACAMTLQYRARAYVPWIYWLNVVLVSVVGTQVTDLMTDKLGISLFVSTPIFAIALAIVFAIWHRVEGTLAITSIVTRRREVFYWAAILLTFALGTAAGDLATEALGMGFTIGTMVFAALIAAIAIAWRLGLNDVLAFWLVYILTRPLGASLGDWLSQDAGYGGLGLGPVWTSVAFLAVIVVLVWTMHANRRALSPTA